MTDEPSGDDGDDGLTPDQRRRLQWFEKHPELLQAQVERELAWKHLEACRERFTRVDAQFQRVWHDSPLAVSVLHLGQSRTLKETRDEAERRCDKALAKYAIAEAEFQLQARKASHGDLQSLRATFPRGTRKTAARMLIEAVRYERPRVRKFDDLCRALKEKETWGPEGQLGVEGAETLGRDRKMGKDGKYRSRPVGKVTISLDGKKIGTVTAKTLENWLADRKTDPG